MRRLSAVTLIGCAGLVLGLAMRAEATHEGCPHDSVRVGTACLDKYEASVWLITPPYTMSDNIAIAKIRDGTVTRTHLTAAGATQLGVTQGDLARNGCQENGAVCVHVYAVSIAGVVPATNITWFQAAAAAANSWKRLPSNAEWTAGALGTPDSGADPGPEDCHTFPLPLDARDATGARANCVSNRGAFDMVGNVWEWVADWVPKSTGCSTWTVPGLPSDDLQCLLGAATTGPPGALIRGGNFADTTGAGVFAVSGSFDPLFGTGGIGFRAARNPG